MPFLTAGRAKMGFLQATLALALLHGGGGGGGSITGLGLTTGEVPPPLHTGGEAPLLGTKSLRVQASFVRQLRAISGI